MLGKKLRELRGARTQEEIADKLDISRPRYSHYENERVQPDHDLLQKMAELHGVSIDYLLGRTDHPDVILEEAERYLADNLDAPISKLKEIIDFFSDPEHPATDEEIDEFISYIKVKRAMREEKK